MISKSLLALGTAALAGVEVAAQAPSNFATIVNGQFHMDGSPLVFAGSNAYYWPFNVVCCCSPVVKPNALWGVFS